MHSIKGDLACATHISIESAQPALPLRVHHRQAQANAATVEQGKRVQPGCLLCFVTLDLPHVFEDAEPENASFP
jgi:hypothetical protein